MLDETQEEDGVRIYLDEMATKKPSSDEEFRPVVSREMSEILIDLAFVGKGFSAMKKLQYGWLEQLLCETFFMDSLGRLFKDTWDCFPSS